MEEIAVEIKNLKKSYKTKEGEKTIFYDNIKIEKGEIVAITGQSGSGKTTLLSVLGLLDGDFCGDYFLFGENVRDLTPKELCEKRKRKIGFVFQNFNLIESLNLLDNVSLPLFYLGVDKKEREEISREALSAVGLLDRERDFPKNLSGGQKQRVAVARAISQLKREKDGLILADEPTGALDEASATSVMKLFFELQKEGKTVIIITHDKDLAKVCQREFVVG